MSEIHTLRAKIKEKTGFSDEEVDYEVADKTSKWSVMSDLQAHREIASEFGIEVEDYE